jgi:hypothetical protein
MLRNLGKFISRLIDVYDFSKIRSINRHWRDTVEAQVSRIRTLSLVFGVCTELLQYDRTIYDELWYKRQMISRQLALDKEQYLRLTQPIITIEELDLGDMVIPQYVVERTAMPDEYYVLLHILEEYPSSIVKMIDVARLTNIIDKQYAWLEQIILTMQDDTALDRILLFLPICSIEHEDQTCYICYVNVIDSLLEDDFPMDQERFIMMDRLDGLDEKTNLIRTSDETQYIPRNIASDLTSFTKLMIKNIMH